MAGYQGYNPYGGYGMPQMVVPQAAQMAYAQQMAAQQAQMQQPNVTVRMVTSRDEATTAQISFDATINVFVNMSAGEVYIKRFNPATGGALFDEFIHSQKAQQMMKAQEAPTEYVTQDRFDALESRVSELADAITSKRTRGAKSDE